MPRVREIWRWVTATRYTRALEGEVTRLRAENRALLNSILGIAGVPPITVPATSAADFVAPRERETSFSDESLSSETKTPLADSATKAERVQVAAPMRRRSWQQINRTLEFESARKKEKAGNGMAGDIPGTCRQTVGTAGAAVAEKRDQLRREYAV